jgi:hypothetical protein
MLRRYKTADTEFGVWSLDEEWRNASLKTLNVISIRTKCLSDTLTPCQNGPFSFTVLWNVTLCSLVDRYRCYQAGVAVTLYSCIREGSVQISAGTPNVVTEVFRYFPQAIQTNAGIVSRSGHYRNLPPFLPPPRLPSNYLPSTWPSPHVTSTGSLFLAYFPNLKNKRRLMRWPCCLCFPPYFLRFLCGPCRITKPYEITLLFKQMLTWFPSCRLLLRASHAALAT